MSDAVLPPPPDLGRRLARFIVRCALGATNAELSREFGLTLIEIDRLRFTHGDPPRIVRARALDAAPLLELRKFGR